jgi:hypothetical protein
MNQDRRNAFPVKTLTNPHGKGAIIEYKSLL